MNEAFFFVPIGRQLFASYHPPKSGNGRVLTVICPPLLVEYTRTWLALRKLALSLAERGQHVLRFDYRGTGDSFGNLEEVTIADWIEDIALAVREGRELSGSNVVRLLGVRVSALLACRAVGAENSVQRLVLWDPISDGAGYIESLRHIQNVGLERNYHLNRSERREAASEYQGFRLSEHMLREFDLLSASIYSTVQKSKLHVVSTASESNFPVGEVTKYTTPFQCKWESNLEDVLTPSFVLERLITCLTAA